MRLPSPSIYLPDDVSLVYQLPVRYLSSRGVGPLIQWPQVGVAGDCRCPQALGAPRTRAADVRIAKSLRRLSDGTCLFGRRAQIRVAARSFLPRVDPVDYSKLFARYDFVATITCQDLHLDVSNREGQVCRQKSLSWRTIAS